MGKKTLHENKNGEYSVAEIVAQNLFFLAYFGIGFMGMLSLRLFGIPLISIIYAIFLVIMLLFVLRKHLCTNCYYYGKKCSTGWGKISSLIFKEKSGNYELGIKLAGITWGFATIVPIVTMSVSLILNFAAYTLILMIVFILLSPVNFFLHKNACRRCKMKNICSMAMIRKTSKSE